MNETESCRQLAASYTHNENQEWEQQQTRHGCHDHRLGSGREEEEEKRGRESEKEKRASGSAEEEK